MACSTHKRQDISSAPATLPVGRSSAISLLLWLLSESHWLLKPGEVIRLGETEDS
ncbi:hypothetical protein [Thermogemmatispora tikiterensis]|uniref:hypothetical protein n=1 Tax=Thermogemmatispora tikiterensis TaxID=1825093 RepID=UPI001CB91806|nr:hypothetical protein [Thermogemmatispora tikiterensis]